MNSVLEEIVRTGRTLLQSGEYAEITGFIDPECGALLQKIIHDLHPKVGIEIGHLGYPRCIYLKRFG